MAAVNEDYVRERLTAYIYPRAPSTYAQETAFDNAVEAQMEYEEAHPQEAVPEGIASMSNDGMTVSYAESGSRSALYTQASISPAAYAFLLNAGLIGGAIPRARRL